MEKIFFTVGPSQVYPTLYKHLNQAIKEDVPSLNHRGIEFKQLFKNVSDNLKNLLNIPKSHQIFFVSSALECMERTVQGCVEKESFHIISGSFGKAWMSYAVQLGKNVTSAEFDKQLGLNNLSIPKNSELICITQNDTSTGIWIPMEDLYNLKKENSEKLIAIDTVSSIPYVDINYKYIDVVFFSVQKGFGLPAGLGVLIVSPKALEKVEQLNKKGVSIGSYHSLKNLSEKAKDLQTPETPNVLNIYLLNKVLRDMLKKGIEKIGKETDKKAEVLYNFFDSHKKYEPFIKKLKFRSPTSLVFDVKGNSEKVRQRLAKKGFIIGAGYGDNKFNHIRIANFPAHSLKDVRQMLKYI